MQTKQFVDSGTIFKHLTCHVSCSKCNNNNLSQPIFHISLLATRELHKNMQPCANAPNMRLSKFRDLLHGTILL